MTRINTNVSSLNAQKTLARNNDQLQTALTRLSTGLRINSGKDDPAGMIAAEMLQNNIVAVQKAISNTQRGNQMIATTDSALGQVTSLLHDIRGLVTEVSNTAVMSDEQIAANQMQVDSALEAINRIAQVTKFQGRRVLDGSLDFITDSGNIPQIKNLKIDQANLGATGRMGVSVEVQAAATQASLSTSSGETQATAKLTFASRANLAIFAGAAGELSIVAKSNSQEFDGVTVTFTETTDGTESAEYNATNKVLALRADYASTTVSDLITEINNTGLFTATSDIAAVALTAVTGGTMNTESIDITAAAKGADFNDVKIVMKADASAAINTPNVSYNAATKELQIGVLNTAGFANSTSVASITAAIDGLDEFSAVTTSTADIWGAVGADLHAEANTGVSGYLTSAFSEGTRAQAVMRLAAGATWTVDQQGGGTFAMDIKATSLGDAANAVNIKFLDDVTAGNESAVYDATAKQLLVHYKSGAGGSDAASVIAAINATGAWKATQTDGTGADEFLATQTQTSIQTGTDSITIEAMNAGANFNNMQVVFETLSDLSAPQAKYDAASNTFTVQVKYSDAAADASTLVEIADAINAVDGFAAYTVQNGTGNVFGKSIDTTAVANTGSTGGNVLLDDLVVEVAGREGSEVFTFNKGTAANQMAAAIGSLSDALGTSSYQNNQLVDFRSSAYGSKEFVSVNIISEGANGTFKSSMSGFRDNGSDVQAKVNGVTARGDGNRMSVNTSMLDLTIDLEAGNTNGFKFNITGGGAQFQLGPDVVTNQQIRMGIKSVNSATLGGVSGKLYELASGGKADLQTDPNKAAAIVTEALNGITELRGRLGALQGLTMETNQKTLEDMLENMQTAQSQIRDADFAAETANLTRAQILVQSGMSVLGIANQNPQSVLSLLR
jgi:flagellin